MFLWSVGIEFLNPLLRKSKIKDMPQDNLIYPLVATDLL